MTVDAKTYCDVRTTTEALAAPLSAEDQTVQSMPDVSPTKWHRAHTTWFFETFLLGPHAARYEAFDDSYAYLFNSYYEAVGPRHLRSARGLITRPGVEEIARYRQHVDRAMLELLDGSLAPDVSALIELGINHEQQHQELLLMDIAHVLACNPTQPAYGALPWRTAGAGDAGVVEHDGGIVDIGATDDGFAFDNERPRHDVLLHPFRLSTALVTNGDWLAFIDDGGYERADLWMSEGWATVQAEGSDAPLYWRRDGGTWTEHSLAGVAAVDPAAPVVHVSWFDADAYARWAGGRLPLEAESEVVAPTPDASGAEGWYGAAWQWTASSYDPYPGFEPAAGAVGEYNGKF
ncbi:MAG: hypothetical protein V7636_121, partial [Actinomycetota bacterium]